MYLCAAVVTFASFCFFAMVPLPRAYYQELWLGRPQELLPAILFAMALGGYLWQAERRRDAFGNWLIASLLVGFVG